MVLKSLIAWCLVVASATAFVPIANRKQVGVSLSMALVSPPPPPASLATHVSSGGMIDITHVATATSVTTPTATSALTQGVDSFMGSSSMSGSSDGVQWQRSDSFSTSQLVALKERKVPTAEELAAKKRNFAWWFWGGGFVAPFLATFYYFGFKFWEK